MLRFLEDGVGLGIGNDGYRIFFERLLDGTLKLGQTLTQEELCQVLGMSLSPMRETMTLLEAEGLIQIRRRIGVQIFYPDVKFVGSTFQFREMLEREGLRKFSTMVTDVWIERMVRIHEDMLEYLQEVTEPRVYAGPVRDLERAFHLSFINVFDNPQISGTYDRLSQKMYILRLLNPESVGIANTRRVMHEHLAVVEALSRRDTAAAIDGLERHIRAVLHRVLTH